MFRVGTSHQTGRVSINTPITYPEAITARLQHTHSMHTAHIQLMGSSPTAECVCVCVTQIDPHGFIRYLMLHTNVHTHTNIHNHQVLPKSENRSAVNRKTNRRWDILAFSGLLVFLFSFILKLQIHQRSMSVCQINEGESV